MIRALVLLLALTVPALAHDSWISQGGYKNAAGELCCGERDCFVVPGEDIGFTAGGYYIRSIRETIPYSEAQPSPDGAFWRCAWGGMRKCFFAPPPSG